VKFSKAQIDLASQLKRAGLPWQPAVGQYALDVDGRILPASPFQEGVYYFHDLPCFIRYFGSATELARAMVWLPTFEEARKLATNSPALREAVTDHLAAGTELDALYRLVLTGLAGRG
jgi:hypothetical protein